MPHLPDLHQEPLDTRPIYRHIREGVIPIITLLRLRDQDAECVRGRADQDVVLEGTTCAVCGPDWVDEERI